LDIWEANARATHLAPHPCNQTGLFECEGDECAFDGVCDKNGCGYNPYANGNPEFYGYDLLVDTTKKFTVVTQFPADSDGNLIEYRRFYIQDGVKIDNAPVQENNVTGVNYMDDEYCAAHGAARYMDLGATAGMGEAMTRGMVLALSVWWDEGTAMTWLDGINDWGTVGPCQEGEGFPSNIREVQPDTSVTFSNIRWGEIDSTYEHKGKCKRSMRNRY
jgi:cellulase